MSEGNRYIDASRRLKMEMTSARSRALSSYPASKCQDGKKKKSEGSSLDLAIDLTVDDSDDDVTDRRTTTNPGSRSGTSDATEAEQQQQQQPSYYQKQTVSSQTSSEQKTTTTFTEKPPKEPDTSHQDDWLIPPSEEIPRRKNLLHRDAQSQERSTAALSNAGGSSSSPPSSLSREGQPNHSVHEHSGGGERVLVSLSETSSETVQIVNQDPLVVRIKTKGIPFTADTARSGGIRQGATDQGATTTDNTATATSSSNNRAFENQKASCSNDDQVQTTTKDPTVPPDAQDAPPWINTESPYELTATTTSSSNNRAFENQKASCSNDDQVQTTTKDPTVPPDAQDAPPWINTESPYELAYSAEDGEPLFQEVASRLEHIRDWCKVGGGNQPDTLKNFILLCNSVGVANIDCDFYSNTCRLYGKFSHEFNASANSLATSSSRFFSIMRL